jgi:hypothetical protein
LEGFGAKDRALAKCGIFSGIFGVFGVVGPNHKYFSETEGSAVIFPNAQGPRQNLQEAQGPKCKMLRNYGFLRFIFQWKSGGPGTQHVDQEVRLGSTVDRGGTDKRARRSLAGARRAGARAHRCTQRRWRRTSRTGRCQNGAHRSMSDDREAAQRR